MTTTITTFWHFEESKFLGHLRSVIEHSDLIHSANELGEILGFKNEEELSTAIQKALNAMRSSKTNAHLHFQQVFCSKNGNLHIDWKLSPLAYYLVILNCNSSHPLVAKMQIELIKHQLEH